jgi:hypothetical protein
MPTNPSIEGYRCKQIRCLAPILKEWIEANSQVAGAWKHAHDVPWWYNERACLSLFAGAIWRAGGFCFEEFSDDKRRIARRTRRFTGLYSGRVDLYFAWHRLEFLAEAKIVWSGFTLRNAPVIATLDKCLKSACADIRKTAPYGQRRLGIVFAKPYFAKTCKPDLNERIAAWVGKLADLETSAYAWVFPTRSRSHAGTESLSPGVAVLIKEVWK